MTANPRIGPGAELEKNKGGNQGGHVGIQDGQGGPVIAGSDGRSRCSSQRQFFSDPFKDNDIGVHRHADRKNNSGNSREGKGEPKAASPAPISRMFRNRAISAIRPASYSRSTINRSPVFRR